MANVVRITMFKVTDPANCPKVVELYRTMYKTQSKDGGPYIVSAQAGEIFDDPRSQGYNFVSRSEFETVEDMNFYESECPAHKTLKAAMGAYISGVMVVNYTPSIIESLRD